MALVSKQVLLVLLALFAQLAQLWAQPLPTQFNSDLKLSCPPGWQVLGNRPTVGYSCVEDPCYGTNNPCGPGNSCTSILDFPYGLVANCTCNPPYQTGIVPSAAQRRVCYKAGQDACSPNPCANGGTCSYVTANGNPVVDAAGTKFAFQCDCTNTAYSGGTCSTPRAPRPGVTASVNGVTGPLATAVSDFRTCGTQSLPPVACLYADQAHFVCCNDTSNCGPTGPDGVPVCPGPSYTPTPNTYPLSTPAPTPNPPGPSPPSPSGDQGVCGSGAATDFPTRCWFNSDPLGRYVCCDRDGCNGFNSDNLFPHCKTNGYVPPNNGLSGPAPPSGPPSNPPSSPPSSPPATGDQGVCGSGVATYFPNRCWFNNDPQGRYVCCDKDGCNGFAPPDYLFPRCQTNGYAPPNFGT